MNPITRRDATLLCAGLALAPPLARAEATERPLLKRPIPHSGEMLPAIGVGTSMVFDVGAGAAERTGPAAVVQALLDHGGTLIDTAPSYGAAEGVIGDIVAARNARGRVFLATKLERYAPGGEAAELRQSLQSLRTAKVDLLQLHNVRDPAQSLSGLNALKSQGLIRYTGVTTTFARAYDAAEAIVRREKPDFLEVDYAIDNRGAENRLLPAAADAGVGVLVALPFGRGRLFRDVLKKPLPDFAAEIDCASWAQFFLKFILGHPAVTAAIPGTDKAEHMQDNLDGGRGRLPDAELRTRMVQYVETL